MLPSTPAIALTITFIEKLKFLSIKFGWVKSITTVCPGLTPEWEHPKTMVSNVFGSIEEWQNRYFRFDLADIRISDYGLAYRQVVCNYISKRLYAILAISEFEKANGKDSFFVSGLSPDIIEAYTNYNSKGINSVIWPIRFPNQLSNLLIAVLIIFYTLLWTLSRIRPYLPPAKQYAVMVDWVDDPDDVNLYREMVDLGEICLIRRPQFQFNSYRDPEIKKFISNCDMYKAENGALTPTEGLLGIWEAISGGLKIFLFAGRHEPALFYKLISLPYKTIMYRSLFRRIQPKIYWGRDAYNVEHIIRHQELKAVKGQSWCYLHGYPTYTSIFPMFRYVSFDRLYAVSRHFYEKDYFNTWNSDIQVVDASTFRASRRVFAKRSHAKDKPSNIVILCGIFVMEPKIIDFVNTLASSFPKRKIYLQIKSGFRELDEGKTLIDACTESSPNLDLSISDIYELFTNAKYVFSDPSTAIMEALQFGSMAFSIDFSDIQVDSPLREFKDICVDSGQTAVRLIKSIEDGSWIYPIDRIKPLANIEGEPFSDTLRRDLGLNPKETARPVW